MCANLSKTGVHICDILQKGAKTGKKAPLSLGKAVLCRNVRIYSGVKFM